MASDVTALSSIIHESHQSGLNCVIIAVSAGTNTDYIDLNDLLEANKLGTRVKYVHYADCIHTPYGVAVKVPMILTTGTTTISDRVTVGGTITGDKVLRITVFYE